jgi:hypothetical protein
LRVAAALELDTGTTPKHVGFGHKTRFYFLKATLGDIRRHLPTLGFIGLKCWLTMAKRRNFLAQFGAIYRNSPRSAFRGRSVRPLLGSHLTPESVFQE